MSCPMSCRSHSRANKLQWRDKSIEKARPEWRCVVYLYLANSGKSPAVGAITDKAAYLG